MQRSIETLNKNTVRITLPDERWYITTEKNKEGIPEVKFHPSVTWITSFYPKGIAYYRWLASKGWNEAEAIKEEARERGSKVHRAITVLLKGETIKINSQFKNPDTSKKEELTVEEYECLVAFTDWFKVTQPSDFQNEITVINSEENYAGTVDLICRIGGDLWIIDFKTGQHIWPSHLIQLSAYKRAVPVTVPTAKLGILQVGYKRNQRKWKLTEVEDQYNLFLATREIWQAETKNVKPLQKDFPTSLKIIKKDTKSLTPKK